MDSKLLKVNVYQIWGLSSQSTVMVMSGRHSSRPQMLKDGREYGSPPIGA